jgi:hypothetical protein
LLMVEFFDCARNVPNLVRLCRKGVLPFHN